MSDFDELNVHNTDPLLIDTDVSLRIVIQWSKFLFAVLSSNGVMYLIRATV